MHLCCIGHAVGHLTAHLRRCHIAVQKRGRRGGFSRPSKSTRPEVEMIMSPKTLDSALDFVPDKRACKGGVWMSIVDAFSAIRQGIDLAGEYKELTGRGMPANEAARRVFDQMGKR